MSDVETRLITCCHCSVLFWVTEGHRDILVKDKNTFYCPSGHAQSFVGKTDKKLLEEEKERSERYFDSIGRSNAEVNRLELELKMLKKKPKKKTVKKKVVKK